jgi:tetratricopeptide (TPR) repeat protein
VDREEHVATIVGDWRERHERGEPVTPEDVIAVHPELADELREAFDALEYAGLVFSGTAPPETSAPDRIGDYRILEELGRGGMGIVYLAAAERDVAGVPAGQRVALKVIHPHLLERRGFFKRFLREAEIGKKVRHENVVRTLDVDAAQAGVQTVHYLVIEYVEGKTLRSLARDLGTVPEALLREIALQTASGLAAIHGAGIVHRDLKPENLLITDDHRVRIMDLGVARPIQETLALTQEDQFAGSLLYAAPEQFERGEVTPAADLYALGVLLYELATGAHPFRADEMAAVMKAHLETVPPRANETRPEISAFFSELLATLLEKEPQRRIESAEALRDLIEGSERTTWWTEREREVRRARERIPAVPVQRETNLYGRETELALLRDAWARTEQGRGNTLLLEGEPGIGKSRLVDAFLRDWDGRQGRVLYGSYPPSGGMGAISDAILDQFGAGDLEERLRPYLTVTPSLVPTFAAIVKHESLPPGAQPLEGDTLHAVCVQLMRALAAERPLLWVIEDLHFGAKESRNLALALARTVKGHRILLVLTTRPGLAEEELAHFSRLENFRRATLGRLSAREVVLLLQDAFRSEALADKLGARIALKSDGVPFFVFEMIRGLKEGQFITELPDGSYVESRAIEQIEVPSAVKDLIEARLRGLAREDRAILDTASVLGFEFDPDLVARVRQLARVQVLEVLGDIERRSGVVRASGSRYRFDHHQIQEVVYEHLSRGLKEEYHTLLAEAFAGCVQGELSGEDHAFLASHHLRGSQPGNGLPHLMPALEQLEVSYRNEAAIELAALALREPGLFGGAKRAEVLLRKAGRHDLRGEWDAMRTALDEALALADGSESAALRARVRIALGGHLAQTAANEDAQNRLEQALRLAREAEDKKLERITMGKLAGLLRVKSCYEEARAHYEQELVLSREIGDRQGEAVATSNLGYLCLCQGRYEEARAQCERGLALLGGIEDRRDEAALTVNLGFVCMSQSAYEEARVHLERHLALCRETGDRRGEATATGNLGRLFGLQQRYEEAHARFERHLVLAREMGDRYGEAASMSNLGLNRYCQGRYEEARAHLEEALELKRELGDRKGEADTSANLGLVAQAQGRCRETHAHHGRCRAISLEIGDRQGEALATGNLGLVFDRLGRREQARQHFERHLALAREIGDRRQEGYALWSLAMNAGYRGDTETALRLHGEALALWRGLGYKHMVADSLADAGKVEFARGDHESAVAHTEEAMALAREVQQPDTILSTTVCRARLPGGDKDAALAALEEHEAHVTHDTKMEARFYLWELTRDRAHLEKAHCLLCFMRDHAPADCRVSMIENFPLHRDIMKAWEEHGARE